jgi:hypothetical protein
MVREFSILVTELACAVVAPTALVTELLGLVAERASAWWTLMTQR